LRDLSERLKLDNLHSARTGILDESVLVPRRKYQELSTDFSIY